MGLFTLAVVMSRTFMHYNNANLPANVQSGVQGIGAAHPESPAQTALQPHPLTA